MSERVPRVFQKTDVLPDAVTLFIDGVVFEGFEDIKITRELNAAASDFEAKITDKWKATVEPWRIRPGQSAHIHIGKKSVFTGWVDTVDASVSSNARDVTIRGRSKTADLVDCSILGDNSYTGLTLKEFATKIMSPFGLTPVFLNDAGDVFQSIVIQQGETAFAALDRLARQRKFVLYPSTEGNLVFSKAGAANAPTPLTQGVNVKSGRSTYDFTNRFSKYVAKAQGLSAGLASDLGISQVLGEATDAGITRYRPKVVISESTSDGGAIEDRAAFEAALKKAQSLKVEVEVQGWFQSSGELWDINQFVRCDIGFLGVKRQMLTKKITYNKNAGTTAQIELCFPDSFDFLKQKKKEDPLGWTKVL